MNDTPDASFPWWCPCSKNTSSFHRRTWWTWNKQLLCLIATSKNVSHSQISFLSHTSMYFTTLPTTAIFPFTLKSSAESKGIRIVCLGSFIWPSNDFPAMLWRRWDLLWTLQVSCAALMVAVGLCSRCLHSLLNVWKGDICQMFMWLTHDKRDTIEQQTDTTKSPEVIYATNSMQFKQVIDTKLHRANCQEPGQKTQRSFREWKCWNTADMQDSMNC